MRKEKASINPTFSPRTLTLGQALAEPQNPDQTSHVLYAVDGFQGDAALLVLIFAILLIFVLIITTCGAKLIFALTGSSSKLQ